MNLREWEDLKPSDFVRLKGDPLTGHRDFQVQGEAFGGVTVTRTIALFGSPFHRRGWIRIDGTRLDTRHLKPGDLITHRKIPYPFVVGYRDASGSGRVIATATLQIRPEHADRWVVLTELPRVYSPLRLYWAILALIALPILLSSPFAGAFSGASFVAGAVTTIAGMTIWRLLGISCNAIVESIASPLQFYEYLRRKVLNDASEAIEVYLFGLSESLMRKEK